MQAKGNDFPEDERWPLGYVPIPIHTTSIENDYLVCSLNVTQMNAQSLRSQCLKHVQEWKLSKKCLNKPPNIKSSKRTTRFEFITSLKKG